MEKFTVDMHSEHYHYASSHPKLQKYRELAEGYGLQCAVTMRFTDDDGYHEAFIAGHFAGLVLGYEHFANRSITVLDYVIAPQFDPKAAAAGPD